MMPDLPMPKEREPWFHTHVVNYSRDEDDNNVGTALRHGALFVRFPYAPVTEVGLEWNFGLRARTGLTFRMDPHGESPIQFSFGLWPFGHLYFGITPKFKGRLMEWVRKVATPMYPQWASACDRELSLRVFDDAVWWRLWTSSYAYSSSCPRWREGTWHPLDTLFGRRTYEARTLFLVPVTLRLNEDPTCEEIYEGKAHLQEGTWTRKRWHWLFKRVELVGRMIATVPTPHKGPWRSFPVEPGGPLDMVESAIKKIRQTRRGWKPTLNEVSEAKNAPLWESGSW